MCLLRFLNQVPGKNKDAQAKGNIGIDVCNRYGCKQSDDPYHRINPCILVHHNEFMRYKFFPVRIPVQESEEQIHNDIIDKK